MTETNKCIYCGKVIVAYNKSRLCSGCSRNKYTYQEMYKKQISKKNENGNKKS